MEPVLMVKGNKSVWGVVPRLQVAYKRRNKIQKKTWKAIAFKEIDRSDIRFFKTITNICPLLRCSLLKFFASFVLMISSYQEIRLITNFYDVNNIAFSGFSIVLLDQGLEHADCKWCKATLKTSKIMQSLCFTWRKNYFTMSYY